VAAEAYSKYVEHTLPPGNAGLRTIRPANWTA